MMMAKIMSNDKSLLRSERCDFTKKTGVVSIDSNFLVEILSAILNPDLWCQFAWKYTQDGI